MRVEEEWIVEDEADRRISEQPAPSRRGLFAVGLIALLGAGLTWWCGTLPAAAPDLPATREAAPTALPTPPRAALPAFESSYFHVVSALNDNDTARSIATRFDRAYVRLCVDLGCATDAAAGSPPYPRVLSMTLIVLVQPGNAIVRQVDAGQQVTITIGLFDEASTRVDRIALESLLMPVARIASGGGARWSNRNDGELFVDAIIEWERGRLRLTPAHRVPFSRAFIGLDADRLPLLRSLWSWPIQFPPDSALLGRMRREAASIVGYIDQQYGPTGVADLMSAIGRADTLEQAIEEALSVDYDQFDLAWRAWLGTLK